jgi:hypothetical protein
VCRVRRELPPALALEKTQDPDVLNFYAEIELAGLSFNGKSKCTTLRREFPEPGLILER